MKKLLILSFLSVLFLSSTITAQVAETAKLDHDLSGSPEKPASNIPLPCDNDPCPCVGAYSRIQVYYFGPEPATLRVFNNNSLAAPFATFNNLMNGQLITINGPGGSLSTYTWLELDDGFEACITRLYTRCPVQSYPGATDDNAILGKTFRNFTVYSTTTANNNFECTLENIEVDWHVGGNIVGATNNLLGTRNAEDVVLITDDTPRGVITADGRFGINTANPVTDLHVNGGTRVNGDFDVDGIASVNNNTGSNSPATGALVVTGGAGIGQNLHVGNDLDADGNGFVGGNLGVGVTPATKLHVEGNGIRLSNGGQRIDWSATGTNGMVSTGSDLAIRTPGNNLLINAGAGDGKVTIGTLNAPNTLFPGNIDVGPYKLYVQGGILTEELRVRTGWADYVFLDGYRLRPLSEVEQFIRKNGHLPDCPSEKEVLENGISVGETAANQQAKIEELFLHLIEMEKKMQTLEAENEALKSRIEQLEEH